MQILDRRTDNIKKVQSALVPPPFYSNFFRRTMAPQISQRKEPFVSNCWNSIGRDYIVRGSIHEVKKRGFYIQGSDFNYQFTYQSRKLISSRAALMRYEIIPRNVVLHKFEALDSQYFSDTYLIDFDMTCQKIEITCIGSYQKRPILTSCFNFEVYCQIQHLITWMSHITVRLQCKMNLFTNASKIFPCYFCDMQAHSTNIIE